jgi:hypothetical protein
VHLQVNFAIRVLEHRIVFAMHDDEFIMMQDSRQIRRYAIRPFERFAGILDPDFQLHDVYRFVNEELQCGNRISYSEKMGYVTSCSAIVGFDSFFGRLDFDDTAHTVTFQSLMRFNMLDGYSFLCPFQDSLYCCETLPAGRVYSDYTCFTSKIHQIKSLTDQTVWRLTPDQMPHRNGGKYVLHPQEHMITTRVEKPYDMSTALCTHSYAAMFVMRNSLCLCVMNTEDPSVSQYNVFAISFIDNGKFYSVQQILSIPTNNLYLVNRVDCFNDTIWITCCLRTHTLNHISFDFYFKYVRIQSLQALCDMIVFNKLNMSTTFKHMNTTRFRLQFN